MNYRLNDLGYLGFQEYRCSLLGISISEDISSTSSKNRKKFLNENPETKKTLKQHLKKGP